MPLRRGGAAVGDGAKEVAGAADNSAHNAASFAQLKLDLKTTESANNVVDSLRATGQLPANYVNKAQAAQQGWQPGKALNNSVPGGQIGGDIFHNTTNILPLSSGRTWFEADIGLNSTISRSNQPGTRLLYSNDGLLYITTDHYKTVAPIGTWK
ncbi:ribonuclease domain-containing protein [Pseudomonas panipatensis]|uniref:ribonuclease domain-containing protein n=1 Tax=Pseudomonas panipatensis TaxID=428992 RepID=UPI001BAF9B81|nr:ribonuclease domain-containing protein [Pseudomonas panipatensis]